jgi:hypothetical protein
MVTACQLILVPHTSNAASIQGVSFKLQIRIDFNIVFCVIKSIFKRFIN